MQELVVNAAKPDDPRYILNLFASGAHKTLAGMIGITDPTTKAITTPAQPGVINKTLQYEADMENAVAQLPSATQAFMAPYLNDARKEMVKDIQIGMENYIKGNSSAVTAAIQQLSGKTGQSWLGHFLTKGNIYNTSGTVPTTAAQWIKDNPKVDPEVLTQLFDAAQRNQAGGDTTFNFMDDFAAALQLPSGKVPTMVDGTPINSPTLDDATKMAGYLASQIASPYTDLINQNVGFTGYSPYPLPSLNLGQSEANPNITATNFEGFISYNGDVNKLQALATTQNPDDGSIDHYNPNGEPIYQRFQAKDKGDAYATEQENLAKQRLLSSDPHFAAMGYTMANTQLDHIVPIEAGGTMSQNNMMLISTQADQNNQLFEDYLGKLYAAGQISRADSVKASIDYKINQTITLQDVYNGKY